jgi:glycine/D-amino acid oxidase-like deaminating enzyme
LEGHQPLKVSRRKFLQAGSAALVGLSIKGDRPIAGGFVNDSFQLGHQLRDRAAFPSARNVEKHAVVIIGGGIAGLSAAWRLHKRGFQDFVLLEMNQQPGGNSRWGENEITAFPWGAHYVPVPGPKTTYVRELFEELGVLKDGVWDERALCFAPQERLFLYGRWQEGIEPAIGLRENERDQSTLGGSDPQVPGKRRVHYPDGAWAVAIARRSGPHFIRRMAEDARDGFADPGLVHELLLP